MQPKMIKFECPRCKYTNKPIPAGMGDKTIKCFSCGIYIKYGWRKQKIEIVERPERISSSGLRF